MAGQPGSYYPPVGFYFKVNVIGINGTNEGNFQEVSGLNATLELESFKEGGENRFVHRLPLPPKYGNLVLRRGILLGSPLMDWVKKALEQFTFTPKDVLVNLLNEQAQPIATWKFIKAIPVSIKISDFKAQENAIAVEIFELSYNYLQRVN
jgi:phage tail-like protein